MNQNDLRVIKTRRAIENALILLLQEKSFEKITVQNILDTALVNRSTFYQHYTDKYTLLQSISDTCFTAIRSDVDRRFSCTDDDLLDIILHLYQSLYEQRHTALVLLHIQTSLFHFKEDLSRYLKDGFITRYKTSIPDTPELDYLSTLYADLVTCSLEWCLKNENISALQTFLPTFQTLLHEINALTSRNALI